MQVDFPCNFVSSKIITGPWTWSVPHIFLYLFRKGQNSKSKMQTPEKTPKPILWHKYPFFLSSKQKRHLLVFPLSIPHRSPSSAPVIPHSQSRPSFLQLPFTLLIFFSSSLNHFTRQFSLFPTFKKSYLSSSSLSIFKTLALISHSLGVF